MLRIDAISKIFERTRAVDGALLGISSGQSVSVIGRSGAGKSTLLRLVNRLIDPTTGRIFRGDVAVTSLHGCALRNWRRQCAMTFHQFNLIGRLDVMNNALTGRLAYTPGWRTLPKLWSRRDKSRTAAG